MTNHTTESQQPNTVSVNAQDITAPLLVTQLEQKQAALEAELAETRDSLEQARRAQAAAYKEAQQREREPQARQQLGQLIPTLEARLDKAPRNSPTAQRVRSSLETLSDERLSAADRLTLCRGLLSDLARLPQLDGDIRASRSPRVAGRE